MKCSARWDRGPSQTLASVSPKDAGNRSGRKKQHQEARPGFAFCPTLPQKEAVPSMLGHQIGILTLLWRDRDKVTQQHSHICVYLLMELVFQQKGESGRGKGCSRLDTGRGGEVLGEKQPSS